MSNPNLRIVVEPFHGIWHKWKWEVHEWREDEKSRPANLPDGESWGFWRPVIDSGWSLVNGYAKTDTSALVAARQRAAQVCEARLSQSERLAKKERDTIVEFITCGGL